MIKDSGVREGGMTCQSCGEPVIYNVPRLGPGGGFVHLKTMSMLCASELTIKDSGQSEEFTTGSKRDSRKGKGRYDLLPCRALRRVAVHFENGAERYEARNWEKGQPLSRYMDCALRHTFKHLEGQRDEDHAAAAAWNLLCLIDTEERIKAGLLPKELDDLPCPIPKTVVQLQ